MVKRWPEDFAESLEVENLESGPLDGDLIDEAIDLVGELIGSFLSNELSSTNTIVTAELHTLYKELKALGSQICQIMESFRSSSSTIGSSGSN